MVMTYFTIIDSFGNTQESQDHNNVWRLITLLRFDWGAFSVQVSSVTTIPLYLMSLSLSRSKMHLVRKKLSCCTVISRFPVPLFSPITAGKCLRNGWYTQALLHRTYLSHVTECWYSRAKRVVNAVCFHKFPAKRTQVSDTTGDMSLFRMNIWIVHHYKKIN